MIKKRITFFIWRLSGRSKLIRGLYIFFRFYRANIFALHHAANSAMDYFYKEGNEIKDKKYRKKLKRDMLLSQYQFGNDFNEYFLYNFDKLSYEERNEFITEYGRYYYYGLLNKPENQKLFYQKDITWALFNKYYQRDLLKIDKSTDISLIESFIKKNRYFICKPLAGWGGKSIRFYSVGDFNGAIDLKEKVTVNGGVVVEELIKQTEFMMKLHHNSVNTIRMTTILDNKIKNKVLILSPILRVGVHGSLVDNAASGGICANIDKISGVIYSSGADEFGNIYEVHPDSDYKFKGLKIPDWSAAVSLVKELALVIPSNRFIGWDLALTDQGWILIEANANAQFVVLQIADKIGKRSELIKNLEDF